MPTCGVWVELTEGNIKNDHIYLRDVLPFFPKDSVGGPNAADAAERSLTIEFQPGGSVETDIAGDKQILRARAPIRKFFALSSAKAGDRVLISKVGSYAFKIELAPR